MSEPSDDRSAVAVALSWTSRITATSLELVIPGLAGYWLDQQLGTKVLFTVVGLALGMPLALWHLLKMTAADTARRAAGRDKDAGKRDSGK